MRHDEEASRRPGRERHAGRRPFDDQPRPPEHEEIEVEFAGPPASAVLPPEGSLETLQGHEEGERPGRRAVGPRRAGRDVEGHDGVPELGLLGIADRGRRVEPGDAAQAGTGKRGERTDRRGDGRRRIADVRPETDVRPDPFHGPGHLHRYARPVTVPRVVAIILHAEPGPDGGPLERALASARATVATRQAAGFAAAGAAVEVLAGRPDGRPFGARLRDLVGRVGPGGLVVLGSGSIPLATAVDRRAFVMAARSGERVALANDRYSADVVAIARIEHLPPIPDLATDNELPRWLATAAGWDVRDLKARRRLSVDLDSPLDVVLVGGSAATASGLEQGDLEQVEVRRAAIAEVAADVSAELVVAGRTSASTLTWLERRTACRVRAFVEERGLRTRLSDQRPAASVLGLVLDREGPGALGRILARLGDAAVVDSRVLLAHRLGTDERAWPPAEDRFASDLLLPERIHDPWLRDLTAAARDARIPILLGGHTLVGPALRLVVGGAGVRARTRVVAGAGSRR